MTNKIKSRSFLNQIVKTTTALKLSEEALAALDEANKKIAIQLARAVKELSLQNEEKEKRAAELILANKELAFQNDQKDKRAAELAIANTELAFQNEQKDKRAAELITANIELAYQNAEKAKRASELLIANKELIFQQGEKKKRAIELIDSNKVVDELEKRVKERTKDLESFSYSVSHDLRTPLRAINGYAKMLSEDYEAVLDSEGKRWLEEVQNNAKKMGILIDDLLIFSKLGRKEIAKSKVDMNALAETVIAEINQSMTHRAEINYTNLLPAMGDYNLLKLVMTNLLSNAIKYSSKKEKPIVEISCALKDGTVIYAVKDNGAGFNMHYVHKLFGVFQRLHSVEEFSGTGVGLASVHRIINKHGGKVWAQGKEGEGADFFFSLACNEAEKSIK